MRIETISQHIIKLSKEFLSKKGEWQKKEFAFNTLYTIIDRLNPEVVAAFCTKEHEATNKAIIPHLTLMLKELKEFYPFEVLEMLDDLEPLYKVDLDSRIQFGLLEKAVIKRMGQGVAKPRKVIKGSTELYGDSSLTYKEYLKQSVNKAKDFVIKEKDFEQPKLVVVLGSLSLILAFLIGGNLMLNMIFVKKPVSHTQSLYVNNYKYVTKKLKDETFVKQKSKYKGNKLRNGAEPFVTCFGSGIVDARVSNRIKLTNNSYDDAVVCIYDRANKVTVRHAYIQRGKSFVMTNIPNGTFTAKVYLGQDWNPLKPNFCSLHGAFDTNPHYVHLSKHFDQIQMNGTNIQQLTIDERVENEDGKKQFFHLSASGYFKNYMVNRELNL